MSANALIALLLEDEPFIAIDVELILQSAGFQVTILVSCEEADDWLDVRRPDVVIIDIKLRDGPSHHIADRLVEEAIPFIVHSGDMASLHAETAFSKGRWIGKPSSPEELVGAVHALLGNLKAVD